MLSNFGSLVGLWTCMLFTVILLQRNIFYTRKKCWGVMALRWKNSAISFETISYKPSIHKIQKYPKLVLSTFPPFPFGRRGGLRSETNFKTIEAFLHTHSSDWFLHDTTFNFQCSLWQIANNYTRRSNTLFLDFFRLSVHVHVHVEGKLDVLTFHMLILHRHFRAMWFGT